MNVIARDVVHSCSLQAVNHAGSPDLQLRMAEEAPNAALSGNRKTSMLSRISQGAAVIVQGPHGKKMERQATDMFKAIDKDGDGTITKEEFAPFYEKMREQARREAEMQERSVTKISKLQHRSRGLLAGIGAARPSGVL